MFTYSSSVYIFDLPTEKFVMGHFSLKKIQGRVFFADQLSCSPVNIYREKSTIYTFRTKILRQYTKSRFSMFTFNRIIVRSSRRLFSTSFITRVEADAAKQAGTQAKVISSCPAGTPLNLKVKKSGPEPVALEDHEYPDWLWDVLDPKKQLEKLKADPAKYEKKLMRQRNRKKIKHNNFMQQMK